MKSVLFLTNLLPYPVSTAGTQTTMKKIDSFVDMGFKVDLFFMITHKDSFDMLKKFINEYQDRISIHYFENYDNRRSIKNLVKSYFAGLPLNIIRNRNKELRDSIDDFINKEAIDFIFCDHLEMVQYIPQKFEKKTIFLDHNAEFMIWERYSKQAKNIVLKIGTYLESLRIKKYERKVCKKLYRVLAAPMDIEILSKLTGTKDNYRCYYHPGNDSLLDLPELIKPKNEFRILFIGNMLWKPNFKGVEWFIYNVLPSIKKKYPDVKFDVIGKIDTNLKLCSDESVIYHGFVDDLQPYYESATVFVSPLLFGSGIKVKNIEAMYRGIPIVTTTIGAESLELVNDNNCFITDSPKEYSDYVITLFEDEKKWLLFSKNSRELSKKYTWALENEMMKKDINELM